MFIDLDYNDCLSPQEKAMEKKWSKIKGYCGKKCHFCPNDVLVRSGSLRFGGKKFRWFLCEICHGKGWQIPTIKRLGNVYRLVYKNLKIGETACIDVLEITEIKIAPSQ